MSKQRSQALERLRATLTPEQKADLKLVIVTAETQGDYHFDGEGSVYSDDVNSTLCYLADELSQTGDQDSQPKNRSEEIDPNSMDG